MLKNELSTVVSVRKVQKYHSGDIFKAIEEIYLLTLSRLETIFPNAEKGDEDFHIKIRDSIIHS